MELPRNDGHTSDDSRPLSISELTYKIKRLLETQISDILVEGEISGFKSAASGHFYFDLKDSNALIHCVVWAADTARIKTRPSDGDKVEAHGRLTVYDQRGQYQLRITSIRPAGLGKLYQAFIEMKERLAAEGLFDPAHKKSIPPHPHTIGIVTSPTSAAIRDMLNILARRAPHIQILIWPVRVQGETAAKEIAAGIQRFNSLKTSIDVLIVGRGGGSLEDLWAFNEEIVARAIFNSTIPVISAIGHETDTTISDFVADLRAPTPSAAAELVARDSSDLLKNLNVLQNRAYRALLQQLAFLKETVHLKTRLESSVIPAFQARQAQLKEFDRSYGIQLPIQRLNQAKQHHDDLLERLTRVIQEKYVHLRKKQNHISAHLGALNPKGILKRGYSITYNEATSRIVSKASDVKSGSPLKIILWDGQIKAISGEKAKPTRPTQHRRTSNVIEWFGLDADDVEN